ncbi:hypothetical protein FF2_009337 [Malus domestica]
MSNRMSGPKRRRMYWGLGRLRSILMATATIDIANLQVFVENGGRTLLSYVGLTFEVCITSVDGKLKSAGRHCSRLQITWLWNYIWTTKS